MKQWYHCIKMMKMIWYRILFEAQPLKWFDSENDKMHNHQNDERQKMVWGTIIKMIWLRKWHNHQNDERQKMIWDRKEPETAIYMKRQMIWTGEWSRAQPLKWWETANDMWQQRIDDCIIKIEQMTTFESAEPLSIRN